MRVRGTSGSTTLARGREAEEWATEFFRRRGHFVFDVSHLNVMHDLVVDGFGRVQVKRAHLVNKHRKVVVRKRKPHRDAQPSNWSYRASLSQGNTHARYPANAWDWLCIVIVLPSGPRFVMRRAADCVVAGKDYMVDKVSIAPNSAALRWQAIDPSESLWGKEAKDGQAAPE
jgi:hypothetical protein